MPEPRIGDDRGDVGDDVQPDVDGGEDQADGLHHGHVALGDVVDQILAHARVDEDHFDDHDADDATLLRVARRATIVWGVVQLCVAIGAQWMQRSVLDNGLAVLSLAAGPVLGAFLVGVLTRRVGTSAMMAGIFVGIAVVVTLWWTGAVAWTWYAFTGAAVTSAVAALVTLVGTRH